jgi:hypothetical protein
MSPLILYEAFAVMLGVNIAATERAQRQRHHECDHT